MDRFELSRHDAEPPVHPGLHTLVEKIDDGKHRKHEQDQHQPVLPYSLLHRDKEKLREARRVGDRQQGAYFEEAEQGDGCKQHLPPAIRFLVRVLAKPVRKSFGGFELGLKLSLKSAQRRHFKQLIKKPPVCQGSGKFFRLDLRQMQANLALDAPEPLGLFSSAFFSVPVRFQGSDGALEVPVPQPQLRRQRARELGGFDVYIAMP